MRNWKTMVPTTANGSVAETFDPSLFVACRPSLPAAMYSAILKLGYFLLSPTPPVHGVNFLASYDNDGIMVCLQLRLYF